MPSLSEWVNGIVGSAVLGVGTFVWNQNTRLTTVETKVEEKAAQITHIQTQVDRLVDHLLDKA